MSSVAEGMPLEMSPNSTTVELGVSLPSRTPTCGWDMRIVSKLRGLPIAEEVKLLMAGDAGWMGRIRMASLRGSMGERDFSGVALFDPVGVALPSMVVRAGGSAEWRKSWPR